MNDFYDTYVDSPPKDPSVSPQPIQLDPDEAEIVAEDLLCWSLQIGELRGRTKDGADRLVLDRAFWAMQKAAGLLKR